MSYCEVMDLGRPKLCDNAARLLGMTKAPGPCDDERGFFLKVCSPGGAVSMQANVWDDKAQAYVPTGKVFYPSAPKLAVAAAGVVGIGLVAYLLSR